LYIEDIAQVYHTQYTDYDDGERYETYGVHDVVPSRERKKKNLVNNQEN